MKKGTQVLSTIQDIVDCARQTTFRIARPGYAGPVSRKDRLDEIDAKQGELYKALRGRRRGRKRDVELNFDTEE